MRTNVRLVDWTGVQLAISLSPAEVRWSWSYCTNSDNFCLYPYD